MDEEQKNPETESEPREHWLDVAADFSQRMDRIEQRQTVQAKRIIKLEGGEKSSSIFGGDDPMMQGIVWIMVLGLVAQVVTPILEAVIAKWSSHSS